MDVADQAATDRSRQRRVAAIGRVLALDEFIDLDRAEVGDSVRQGRKKSVRGIWVYKEDRTSTVGLNTLVWAWDNIANLIDCL